MLYCCNEMLQKLHECRSRMFTLIHNHRPALACCPRAFDQETLQGCCHVFSSASILCALKVRLNFEGGGRIDLAFVRSSATSPSPSHPQAITIRKRSYAELMQWRLSSMRGLSRLCLPRHDLRNSAISSGPIWTWLSGLINRAPKHGTPLKPGTLGTGKLIKYLETLSEMPKQRSNNAGVPRLTLEQVGRLVGTNDKGQLVNDIRDVVFLAIDCEAYEFAQHKVGGLISTLGSSDLAD